MTDPSKVALSILGAGLLIAASILYVGNQLVHRLAGPQGPSTPQGPLITAASDPSPRPTPGEPTPKVPLVDGVPADRRMTFDLFHRFWTPAVARRAERECWQPLEAAQPGLTATPGFEVSVSPDGAVTDVKPDRFQYAESPRLFDCLAQLIRTMRFPAPGKAHTGPVQADRPPRP